MFSILPDRVTIRVDPCYDQRENTVSCKYRIDDYPIIKKLINLFKHKLSSDTITVSDNIVKIKIPELQNIPYRIADIQVGNVIITLKKE